MGDQVKRIYSFGRFRLDATERVLLRDGEPVSLTPKAIETLVVLVENHGHIVEKDDLMRLIWPDTFVGEDSLTRNISVLRRHLGVGSADSYIETLPKRGYRFVAEVSELQDDRAYVIVNRKARLRITTVEETSLPGEIEGRQRFVPRLLGVRSNNPINLLSQPIVMITLAALLIGSIGTLWYFFHSSASKPVRTNTGINSLAVLPLRVLSKERDEEYLGVGIADALITRLGNLGQITLRPTSAVLKYDKADLEATEIGRALKVDSVLEGSIQLSGERMRVTLQLVRTSDGLPLWTGKFDERFTDALAVEDSISESVTQALALRLTREQVRLLARHYTEDPEAHDLYLRGRYYWNKRSTDALMKAAEYFNQAVERDPTYALAYIGLADSYHVLGDLAALAPQECYPKARAAALRAVEIDETLAEAHASLAVVKMQYDWDWPTSQREFTRSIGLNPDYASAHQWYGQYYEARGQFDEALAELKQAQKLDPLSLNINNGLGLVFYYARQYQLAIDQLNKTLELDSSFSRAHFCLGRVYLQKAMHKEAVDEFQKAILYAGRTPHILSALGYAYAVSGQINDAQKILGEVQDLSKQRYVSPIFIALIYTGLGNKNQAFEWLERAYTEHTSRILYLKVDPLFDSLRSDPRFQALLRRVGLVL